MDAVKIYEFKSHEFPKEVIGEVVRMYFRYNLSLRNIVEIFLHRNIEISHEIIRLWIMYYGHKYSSELKKRKFLSTRHCHIDEVFLTIKGKLYYEFRAVNEEGKNLKHLCKIERIKNCKTIF